MTREEAERLQMKIWIESQEILDKYAINFPPTAGAALAPAAGEELKDGSGSSPALREPANE